MPYLDPNRSEHYLFIVDFKAADIENLTICNLLSPALSEYFVITS